MDIAAFIPNFLHLPKTKRIAIHAVILICLSPFVTGAQTTTPACTSTQFDFSFWDIGNFRMAPPVVLADSSVILGCIDNYSNQMIKLGKQGDTAWVKNYNYPNSLPGTYVKTILDYDGNLLTTGQRGLVLKTDTAGNPIKVMQFNPLGSLTRFEIADVHLLANGDKAMLITGMDLMASTNAIMVVDKNMTAIKWVKLIINPYPADGRINGLGFLGYNDKLILSTTFYKDYFTAGTTALTMFNAGTGQILAQHFYTGVENIVGIGHCNNGYVLTSMPPEKEVTYIRADDNLNIVSATSLAGTKYFYFSAAVHADGSITGAYSRPYNIAISLFNIGANDKARWADSVIYFYETWPDIKIYNNNIYVSGNFFGDFANTGKPVTIPYILTADINGNSSSCNYQYKTAVYPMPASFNTGSPTGSFADTSLFNVSTSTVTVQKGNGWYTMSGCYSVINCSSVKVKGNNAVCGSSATYTAQKNAGCTLPVNWSVRSKDSAFVTLQYLNDSMVNLSFSKSGSYQLTASIYASCDTIVDALIINANVANASSVSLGSDTTLCSGDSLLLHAGPGFKTYTWQDGSSDSVYMVKQKGKYFYAATSYCNTVFYDTIQVNFVNPQSFSVVADTSKCIADSIIIKEPAVFKNTSVAPMAQVSINGAYINFYTTQTRSYVITAIDGNGCKTAASINVQVYPLPVINIGNDTAICTGSSIALNAGPGFARYRWSNGDTLPQTTVQQAGLYSIAAYTANGCLSADSVFVQLYSLPVTGLNKITTICTNSTQTLAAKNGYKSYLWSDGSTQNNITVQSTGQYWVHVTDSNGCTAGDTTVISQVLPQPAQFLPADTTVCSYQQLVLKANGNFKSYKWYNGSTQNYVTITQPGTYYLTVTGFNGCTGADTTAVALKQCMEGFYIPTAFTPNNDNSNDFIRPLLFGNVLNYRFTVFNRWGIKVFETTALMQGWDGTLNGQPQDAGTFIWFCTYQLAGQKPELKKGNFVLIR